jgi:hypothetical protein
MAITHDWKIRGVDHDSANNRIKRVHWYLESYDGDTKADTYGVVEVSTVTVLPNNSLNNQAATNLLFQELGLKKQELESSHGQFITERQGSADKTKVTTGTVTNASVIDNVDYTTVTNVTELLPVPNKTFNVKVATKTAAHPEFGKGSENGYTVDNVEGATLSLLPGQTYRFSQADASNTGHPLRIYKGRSKVGAVLAGVTSYGTPGIHGAFTQITIPLTDPHTPLYYQCSLHAYMGGRMNVEITTTDTGTTNTSSSNEQQSSSGQQQSSSGQQQSSSGQQQSSGY